MERVSLQIRPNTQDRPDPGQNNNPPSKVSDAIAPRPAIGHAYEKASHFYALLRLGISDDSNTSSFLQSLMAGLLFGEAKDSLYKLFSAWKG